MSAQDNLPPEVQPAALPSSSGPQEASCSPAPVAPVALRQERKEWPSEAELEKLIAKLPACELAWAYQSGLVIRELVNQRWAANR